VECLGVVLDATLLCNATGASLDWAQPGSRRDVVNVVLNVTGNVVGLCRDVLETVWVVPDVEAGKDQVLEFFGRCVELNPLEGC
jgi:hypothetical protein